MSDSDEEALVEQVQSGDVEALARYIDLHRSRLLAFIVRRMSDALRRKVEPDDILQEVCTSAVRSLPDYEMKSGKPFSWLCELAQRRIVDAHRYHIESKKRSAEREVAGNQADSSRGQLEQWLVASMTTATQKLSRNRREALLEDALGRLSEDEREALRLRYGEGLESKEIAARLGKSNGAVRVMMTRAKAKLQQQLSHEITLL